MATLTEEVIKAVRSSMGIYKVAQHPKDKKFYVVGHIRSKGSQKGYWMPVSDGYAKKEDAEKWAKKQPLADRDARRLVASI
jgi:hypothetical protein